MKFRSPGDEPIYVCLTSGHSAVIGREWRELPASLHRAAIGSGAITDNMSDADVEMLTEAAKPQESNHDALVRVIKAMMDSPQQGDFTQDGLPNMKRVKSKVSFQFTKDELMQAVYAIGEEE